MQIFYLPIVKIECRDTWVSQVFRSQLRQNSFQFISLRLVGVAIEDFGAIDQSQAYAEVYPRLNRLHLVTQGADGVGLTFFYK